jgi:hypothetical protein
VKEAGHPFVQAGPIQAIIAAEMEAPPGPLRSPDGLQWWDGKAWQPIASLGVPPPPAAAPEPPPAAAEPAKEEATSGGAWQPPAEFAQPPPQPPQPTEEVPHEGPWLAPPGAAETPAAAAASAPPAAWQPPPGLAETPAAATAPAPPAWQPPPEVAGQAPSAPPPAADTAPASLPGPPPGAAPEPPKAGVPWPNWLPRDERSEAAVESVPTRGVAAAAKPAPASPGPAPVPVAAGGRPSSWMDQLSPAAAVLSSNRRIAIYGGLAILGLIALYVLFQVLSQMNLFALRPGPSSPTDTGPVGTQFQQADGFLSGSLNPALSSVAGAVGPIALDCQGTHSVTCRNTLQDANAAMAKAITAIDRGTFPSCMSASVVQTRRDLEIQEQALTAAVIGFRANNDDLITKGLADYTAAAPTLKADADTLKTAESICPKSS